MMSSDRMRRGEPIGTRQIWVLGYSPSRGLSRADLTMAKRADIIPTSHSPITEDVRAAAPQEVRIYELNDAVRNTPQALYWKYPQSDSDYYKNGSEVSVDEAMSVMTSAYLRVCATHDVPDHIVKYTLDEINLHSEVRKQMRTGDHHMVFQAWAEFNRRIDEVEKRAKVADKYRTIIPRFVIDRRFKELDDFARNNPGAPVSSYLLRLFPELGSITHSNIDEDADVEPPKEAPVLWKNRDRERFGSDPAKFTKEIYAPWIGRGLTRVMIRNVDPYLDNELRAWLKAGNQLDFELPTKKQQTRSWVSRIKDDPEAQASMRLGNRFRSAKARHGL